MKKNGNNILSDVQKIRFYVMNLIYHHGDQSVKISSSRELADEFHVDRSTVRIALEKMTKEGCLITRRGVGTFTNPVMAFRFCGRKAPALIGLKMFHGDQFYFDAPLMRTISQILWSLAGKNYSVRLLNAGGDSAEAFKLELEYSYVDAVICYGSTPFCIEQAAAMLPTLSIGCAVDQVSAIEYNAASAAAKLVAELRQKTDHPRILWAHGLQSEAFRSAIQAFPDIELVETDQDHLNLAALPWVPDAVVVYTDQLEELHRQLRELKIEPDNCRLIATTISPSDLPYWLLDSPRREACELAAEIIGELLAEPKKIIRRSLDYVLQPMNMGPGSMSGPGDGPSI